MCVCVCVCRHVWVYERESIRMWVWRAHVHTFEQLIVFCSDSLLVMAITGSLFMTKCRWIPQLHLYLFNLWAYVCVCVCVCVCVGGGGGYKMPETQETYMHDTKGWYYFVSGLYMRGCMFFSAFLSFYKHTSVFLCACQSRVIVFN